MPPTERLIDCWVVVIGAACFVWGFYGKDLRNTADFPLTQEEREDHRPPSLAARFVYIAFSGAMMA